MKHTCRKCNGTLQPHEYRTQSHAWDCVSHWEAIIDAKGIFETTQDALDAISTHDIPKLAATAEHLGMKSLACIHLNRPINAKDYARFAAYYGSLAISQTEVR